VVRVETTGNHREISPGTWRLQAPQRSGSALALLVISLGYLMVIADSTAVNVALPAVGHDTHGDVTWLQWVVDGYTLSFAGLLLTGGALSERLGARRVFLAGLALFAVASAACGLAPSLPAVVAARVAQGAGAALQVPASLVLLQAAYPTRAGRARAFGVWGAIAGIGAASGPVVGGLLVSAWSWRAVFFLNLPLALTAIVLGARSVPAPERRERDVDLPGQVLAVAALGLLTAALVQAGRAGWASPLVAGGVCLAAVAAGGFVLAERAAAQPMLPLQLFTRPAFRSASAVGLLINLGFYGQLFVMSLYLQDVRGYSALAAGLALLPEAALISIASAISGRIMARTGARLPMLIGLFLGSAGLAGLVVAGANTAYLLLVAPMAAAGFGMALTMPAATATVIEAAPSDRGGIASGVINAARQAGGVLGVALLGSMVRSRPEFIPGLHAALAVAAASFLAGALITLRDVRPAAMVAACTGRGSETPLRRS
jgi:MFS transporter, DHA2 family, methylenomycin A resistance protein